MGGAKLSSALLIVGFRSKNISVELGHFSYFSQCNSNAIDAVYLKKIKNL